MAGASGAGCAPATGVVGTGLVTDPVVEVVGAVAAGGVVGVVTGAPAGGAVEGGAVGAGEAAGAFVGQTAPGRAWTDVADAQRSVTSDAVSTGEIMDMHTPDARARRRACRGDANMVG